MEEETVNIDNTVSENVPNVEDTEAEVPEEEELLFEPLDPVVDEVVSKGKLTNPQAEKLLRELQEGRKEVEIEGKGKFYIEFPSNRVNQKADMIYSKTLNEALLNGLPMREELEKMLISKGLIEDDSKKDSTFNKIQNEIKKEESLINKLSPEDKNAKNKAKHVAKIREELFNTQVKKNTYLERSAESYAEGVRNNYVTSQCCFREETGEPVWPTYEDFLNEKDQILSGSLYYEFITFSYGLPSNYMEEFPEVKFEDKD